MGVTFTKEQQQAIDERGHNILVSASAGAGKTATLTTRLVNRLKERHDKTGELINIDELLIVTFTRKAAQEMKDRLQKRLTEAVQTREWQGEPLTDEEVSHFEKQILNLFTAPIGTIDSFCQHIVKDYYYLIEDTKLDSNPRMLDEKEGLLLLEEARDKVRDAWLDDRHSDQTEQKKDAMTQLLNQVGSNLEVALTLIQKMRSYPQGEECLDEWLSKVPQTAEACLTFLADDVAAAFQQLDTILSQCPMDDIEALEQLQQDSTYDKKIKPLEELIEFKENLMGAGERFIAQPTLAHYRQFYQSLKDLPSLRGGVFHNTTLKKIASDFPEVEVTLKTYKTCFTKTNSVVLQQLLTLTMFHDEEESLFNLEVLVPYHYQLMTTLMAVTRDIFHTFQKIKEQKQACDYADIEKFAYDLIMNHKEVRETYQNQFQEIMIDEYQDVNDLQQSMMEAISNGHNLFMVGDIKQSIYGFRQANPQLFNEKSQRYQQEDNDDSLIVLKENFRSRHTVLTFINAIFRKLMSERFDHITYDQQAELVVGNAAYTSPEAREHDPAVDILLYEIDKENTYAEDVTIEQNEGIYALIALAMKRLHEENNIPYGDMALLVDKRTHYATIKTVLQQLQLPYILDKEENYFQTTEISQVMSYLAIIDNPYQDIPLVTVLKSPFVQLTEDAFANIQRFARKHHKTSLTFYQRVMMYAEAEPSDDIDEAIQQRLQQFLIQLESYRDKSRRMSVHALIWDLYQETHFIDYIRGIKNGEQRVRNLHALYDRAQQYEDNGFKGLYQFIQFINKLKENDQDIQSPVPFESDDSEENREGSIHVMTVHMSKGLEFPYVFYIPQEGNKQTDTVLLGQQCGPVLKSFTEKQLFKIDHPLVAMVKQEQQQQQYAEQFRNIYVALTRAEQKLIIVGDMISDRVQPHVGSAHLSYEQVDDLKPFEWLIQALWMYTPEELSDFALNHHTISYADVLAQFEASLEQLHTPQTPLLETTSQSPVGVVKQAMAMMTTPYPERYAIAQHEPNYASVSDLKRANEDPDALTSHYATETLMSDSQWAKPRFMDNDVTPTQLGTAVHLVMEKIDLTAPVTPNHVKTLIQSLVQQGAIDDNVARRISIAKIMKFFETSLGQTMLEHPDQVYREQLFSMLMDAGQYNEALAGNNDDLLIHGIIDGYIVLENDVILYDYKTNVCPYGQRHQTFIQHMVQQYQVQMALYKEVLQATYPDKNVHAYLYLFSIDKAVLLDEEV